MLDSSGAFGAGRSAGSPQDAPDISALARVHGVACIERLVRILDGADAAAAVEAARLLLAYGEGLPAQPLSIAAGGIHIELNAGAGPEEPHRANGESANPWAAG